jgi:hypothetical protein
VGKWFRLGVGGFLVWGVGGGWWNCWVSVSCVFCGVWSECVGMVGEEVWRECMGGVWLCGGGVVVSGCSRMVRMYGGTWSGRV